MSKRRSFGDVAKRFSDLPASFKALALAAIAAGIGGVYYSVNQTGCAVRDLGEMEEHLADRGTVIYVGADSLADLDAPGCRLVPLSRHDAIRQALEGRDEAALVAALEEADVRGLLVGADEVDPQLMPEPTLHNLLSNYEPLDHFHAVYLSQAAGLFEVVEPVTLSDAAGVQLVQLARAVMAGEDPPRRDELHGEIIQPRRNAEVSILLQGLRPLARQVRTTNFVRRDYYVLRQGDSLRDATVDAAARLRERWAATGNERREGPIEEALERLHVEVEVFYDRTPIALDRGSLNPMAYRRYLWRALELGVHGVTGHVEGQRDVSLLPSAAVYWSRPDVRSYLERLGRKFDLNGDGEENAEDAELYATSPELSVERFRTFHFRETTPGGEVRRLRRGFVPTGPEVVSREGLREAVRLAAGWLVHNIQDDGLFEYKYYPTRDTYYREFQDDDEEAHNIVRHALASYSLFMVYRELEDEEVWEAALSSLNVLLDNTVVGPEWYEEESRRARLPERRRRQCSAERECESHELCLDGFCRLPFGAPVRSSGGRQRVASGDSWESHDGYRRPLAQDMMYVRWKDVGKMGAAAATVMALTEAIAGRPELLDEYRPYLEGYAAFFLFMQRRDGSFNHYFTAPGDVRYYATETTIYPGEILFAISRIHRLMPREELATAYQRGHAFYARWFREEVQRENDDGTYDEMRRNDLVAFAPWFSMADNDMYQQVPNEEYGEVGVEASDWLAQRYQFDERRTYFPSYVGSYYRVWWEQPAMHGIVYTEGSAAAFDLARRVGNEEAADRLRIATQLGCRFAIQQTIRPEIDDAYLPGNRARVRSAGGVRFSLTVSDLRTDYTYHALSAMVQTLRYFRDDDWPTVEGAAEESDPTAEEAEVEAAGDAGAPTDGGGDATPADGSSPGSGDADADG